MVLSHRATTTKGGPSMGGILEIIVIVVIVLFVLGYFGRGRFRT